MTYQLEYFDSYQWLPFDELVAGPGDETEWSDRDDAEAARQQMIEQWDGQNDFRVVEKICVGFVG